jgi:hypothetical protein
MCPDSFKQFTRTLLQQVRRNGAAQIFRLIAGSVTAHHPASLRIGHRT